MMSKRCSFTADFLCSKTPGPALEKRTKNPLGRTFAPFPGLWKTLLKTSVWTVSTGIPGNCSPLTGPILILQAPAKTFSKSLKRKGDPTQARRAGRGRRGRNPEPSFRDFGKTHYSQVLVEISSSDLCAFPFMQPIFALSFESPSAWINGARWWILAKEEKTPMCRVL
jgi:hypothetical protein